MAVLKAKPQMGDIGFVSIRGGAGIGIRLGQWLNGNGFRDYQHAFIVIDNGSLVEAEPGGARVTSLHKYDGTNVTYYSNPDLTDAERGDLAGIAQHLRGTPYSFIDYLAIALLRFHLPSKALRNYVKSTRHLICSQLCDWVYAAYGKPIFDDKVWPGDVTPLELLARVQELGWEKVPA